MRFDLHVHTNFSDGHYSPEQIIDIAVKKGLNGIAITDHDTVKGLDKAIEYSKNKANFELIPGIEFGASYKGDEVHILGYFIDYNSEILIKAIEQLNTWRNIRTDKIIEKLELENLPIDKEDVFSEKGGFTGRVPIAKAMMKKGYVETIGEAFDKYIGIGNPCYIPKRTYSIQEIIDIIKSSGGVAVLAHPILLNDFSTIEHVVSEGVDGIECIHSKHSKEDIRLFLEYAKDNNLLVTGGSDCHGRLQKDGELLIGKYSVGKKELDKIKELHYDRK